MTDHFVISVVQTKQTPLNYIHAEVLLTHRCRSNAKLELGHHTRDERHPATHAFQSYQSLSSTVTWLAEFDQNTDKQDCSLTLCTRKPNAEWLVCSLSCDRQAAASFCWQIMTRLDCGSGIIMKMCTKSVSLFSRFITSQLFILLQIFCLSLNIFISQSPLWPLVFTKS